jgi:hypothetical protein
MLLVFLGFQTDILLHSVYILGTFFIHSLYILYTFSAFCVHSLCILCTFCIHSPYILYTFSVHSVYILCTFCIHSPYILYAFSVHSVCILCTFYTVTSSSSFQLIAVDAQTNYEVVFLLFQFQVDIHLSRFTALLYSLTQLFDS